MNVLIFLILCFASIAFAEDFRAIDGKDYKDVRVMRVEPDGIVLMSKSGILKVYFIELPKEVQDHFHYDATAAAAYSAEQTASQMEFQNQQSELRRKLAEEKSRYWTGQEPAKNQDKLVLPDALVTGRGLQVQVISHGAPVDISQHLAFGNVTLVDFYADWCGPCRQLAPSLEQMARTDPEITLRKIDIVNWETAVVKQYNIHSIPQVNVYDRNGRLVGTVVGADVQEVRRCVAQAKTSG